MRGPDGDGLRALEGVLPRLDAASIYERLEAQDDLRREVGSSLATVEALLARPNLSAEQAERLSTVGYSIFAAQPRAAMGVRFALTEGNGDGVVIEGALQGFDAAGVLLPGDTIRTIAGVPIRAQMDARRVIISFEPGEQVAVEIVRQGQVRDVTVRLGAFSELNNGIRTTVDSASLRLAWETRVARLRHALMEESLPTGLSRDRQDALRLEGVSPVLFRVRGQGEAQEVAARVGDGPVVTAGGSSRVVGLSMNRLFHFRATKANQASELDVRTQQSDKVAVQERLVLATLRDPRLTIQQRLRQEFNLAQNRRMLLTDAAQRRDDWKRLREEQEAAEEPH